MVKILVGLVAVLVMVFWTVVVPVLLGTAVAMFFALTGLLDQSVAGYAGSTTALVTAWNTLRIIED